MWGLLPARVPNGFFEPPVVVNVQGINPAVFSRIRMFITFFRHVFDCRFLIMLLTWRNP